MPTQPTIDLLRQNPGRVIFIAAVLAAAICAFAYTGGFFSPHRISADRLVDAIEASGGGAHEGFRRAHAKRHLRGRDFPRQRRGEIAVASRSLFWECHSGDGPLRRGEPGSLYQ